MIRLINISMARAAGSLLLHLALYMALGLPAQAQNLCATQASPINPAALASSGVGGTGATATELANPSKGAALVRDGTGGIGGTGVVAGRPGIGGTGIVGIITGFASICVNGVEVYFDASTPVSDNGQPSSARQLAVGQVVAIRAAGVGAEVAARNIVLIHAAVGPVDALNAKTGEFRILGQTAWADDPGELSGLKTGDWVRVSGHRLVQGDIAASRIEPIPPQTQVQLNGTVSQIDADTFTVYGTRVRLHAPPLPAEFALGREVLVRGTWDGTTLQAQHIQIEPTRDGLGPVDQVVLEGYVHALGRRELDLGLGPLTLSHDLQIVGGSAAQLTINQHVQVSGRVGADQRVTVERLEFRNDRSGSDGRSRPGSHRGKGASDGAESPDHSGPSGSSGASDNSGSSGSSGSSGKSGGSGGSGSSGGSGGSGRSGGSGGSGHGGGRGK